MLAVAVKFPLVHDLIEVKQQTVVIANRQHLMISAAEFAVAHPLAFFL